MNSSGVLSGLRNPAARIARSLAGALAALFLAAAPFAAAQRSDSREPVVLQLKWRHTFQFAGYYAAIEKGFYRDEGLQVLLIEGRPGVDFIDQVVSGKANYGVESPILLLAHSRGEPVVVLASVFQHSPLILLARKDSGLCMPQALVRKKVMMTRDSDAELLAMFSKEGIPTDEINMLPHSWDLEDLISGRADAVSAYFINEPFVLTQRGIESCIIRPVTYGIDFYGDCLFTSEQELRKHPRRVAAFRRASLRGWEYAMANPGEIIALIREKYRPDQSEEKLRFEAEEMRKLLRPEFVAIGHMNPGRWRHIAETYAGVGMLPPGYSLSGFLYSPETGRLPPRARKAIFILSSSLLLVVLLIVGLYLFNRNLEQAVSARTSELSHANALLTREAAERWRSERAARESSENLAITLRSIGDAVIAADSAGRVTQMNPVAEALTGWTAEEALHKPIDEVFRIIHAKTREKAVSPMESVLRNGVKIRLASSTALVSRSGKEYLIADSAAPIRNAAGQIIGVVLVFRDVTEIYAQEERLRKSEAKYRLFFENSRDAMLIFEKDRFIDCNASTVSLMGYSRKEELINRHPAELSPEFQPDGRRSDEKAEEMIRIAQEQNGHRFEWDHLRKDGSVIPIEVSLTATEGENGIRLQTVWRDLTGRKQAEEERERLMMAIDQAAEILMITDAEASIQYVNPAFEQITGYSRKEVTGKNPRILQGGKHSPGFYKEMWEHLSSGKAWAGRFINKKKDGSLYTEEANISPVYDAGGKIINYVAAKADITHEIELEGQLRQAQKMEAVGQMAGGIAHDFNNLLQVISGYAELAGMSGIEGTPLETPVREIIKAALRGKTIVSQLLAFSRSRVMNRADIDLNPVIRSLLDMIRSLVGEHIELSFVAGNEPAAVHADPGLIGQVLINLCVNARDAMPQGGKLVIETSVVPPADTEAAAADVTSPPGPCVLLSVTDTGCGMDEKTCARIFEPFFTTKESGKGTGLGLSVVYGILNQHNGQIHVHSEPGIGTAFKIYLPAGGPPAAEISGERSAPAPGGTETLLLAEDDEAVLRLSEFTLRRAGYTVLSAVNGEEAVRVFKEHADEIGLVILDAVMPKTGGKAALEKIRECRPDVPCLFASGGSSNTVQTNPAQELNLPLLSKPYSADELLRTVRGILDA